MSGDIAPDFDAIAAGFSAAIALKNPEMPVADSIAHAKKLLARAAYTYLQAQK